MEELRIGENVNALIYNMDQKWIDGTVVGMTSKEEMKHGYRFGIFVEIYDGLIHWVRPSDVKLLIENAEKAAPQETKIEPESAGTVISTDKAKGTLPEPISEDKEPEKPKRTRRTSTGEKKATPRRETACVVK